MHSHFLMIGARKALKANAKGAEKVLQIDDSEDAIRMKKYRAMQTKV